MLKKLSKDVIERAYLNEKPILFLYSLKKNHKKSGELIKLYQKGVGENKVTSIELRNEGHFENFNAPDKSDLDKLSRWVKIIIKESFYESFVR